MIRINEDVTIIVVDQLEILDRGLCNAAVEIEHVRLSLVIPDRRFVVQFQQVVVHLPLPSICSNSIVLFYYFIFFSLLFDYFKIFF